ncbi:MAG TPA: ABC transporter ATP-binding protein [Candidatus Saccharimonadales bacterium]|nr:ABC transporter ATP-binding protein [Candidatus Saccharimonadales bacterium]
MPKPILIVKDLTKKYGDKTVVKGISFEVERGEIFGILGPNGAGKTTTLEMIETIRQIDSGTATVDGLDVTKNVQKVKQIIGVQPQSPAFMDKVKLTEQLEQMASTYGSRVDSRKLLEEVGLLDKANSYVENLSGGQKQRFSIVAALVHQPKIFFMDEPTTGLDPGARRNLWDLVKEIRSKGTTVILTTHYMEEAQLLCDRVAIMDNGVIVKMDTPKKLIRDLLQKGFTKKEVVQQADLEDVFIDLTGKELKT